MEYNLISGDSHIDLDFLPGDLFVSSAPAAWRHKMPHVVETDHGHEWRVGDLVLSGMREEDPVRSTTPETVERTATMAATAFFEDARNGNPHPTNVDLRLKDQDLDGVDAEVIYGLSFTGALMLGIFRAPGSEATGLEPDPEQVAIIYSIYNDWLADFCKQAPQRLTGLACLPNHDPAAAAAELRRVTKMGLKGGTMDVKGAPKPVYYRDWDVLWAASAECQVPVHFHLLVITPRAPNSGDYDEYYYVPYRPMLMVLAPLEGPELLISMIMSGACERYPDFKFVLGECGASWVPFVLDRMDHECKTDYPGLTMVPSDYWRRQSHTTYQEEGIIGELVSLVGEDNVMWGSDYPHPDGVWPNSREIIRNNLRNLKDERVRRKIICDNAARLYGFK